MNAISKDKAQAITKQIQNAIAEILVDNGLTIDKLNTTYGEYYQFKVQASIHAVDGNGVNVNSREMDDLRFYAPQYGITDIEADINGETIHIGGKEYVPAGYKPRASKRPFMMKCVTDGKTYVFSSDVVKYFPSYDKNEGWMNPARELTNLRNRAV